MKLREKLRGRAIPLAMVALVFVLVVWLSWPQQEGDADFDARVAQPAYTEQHPRVLFDEAHWNVHKSEGRYKPFTDLVRNDGYEIVPNKENFSAETLRGYDVLVIANALGFRGSMQHVANLAGLERKVHVGGPAFSEAECDAVREWVKQGGALLLIADHAPAGEAARPLALRFGMDMTNWYAEEPKNHDPEFDNWGFILFTRENGGLMEHPITQGRNEKERLNRVMSFTGQSLKAATGSVPFLRLSPEAREYEGRGVADDDFRSAAGLAQGVALEFGKGRVVVLGEAAMLTSQTAHSGGRVFRFGMSRRDTDDRQFALNVMHWLTRLLN